MTGGICNHWELQIQLIIHCIFFYTAGLKKRKYSCSTSSEYFKVSRLNYAALFIIYYLWVTLEEKIKPLSSSVMPRFTLESAVCAQCRSGTDEGKAPLAVDANDVKKC